MSFEEWHAIVKSKILAAGLSLPEEEELMILAHMECAVEEKSVDDFIEAYKAGF